MFKTLKKIFHNQKKETIRIFEENTKIDYDQTIFSSLKILSLTNSQLNYLPPLAVFVNLEILNLSNNKIKEIDSLKDLKKLKIIDLRFNSIEKIPIWIFNLNKTIYWERTTDEQEGIYLEGNPLNSKLIDKIKKYPIKKNIVPLLLEEKKEKPSTTIEVEQLTALNRQRVTLFIPQLFSSKFINSFISSENRKFKLNIFTIEYDDNHQILEQEPLQELKYIILILKETECCINPPILELLSKCYSKSKIFLIIENSQSNNIQEKITFFKTYNKSIHIIEIYHSFDSRSNNHIKKEIYNYLEKTQEVNSLWKKSWIELRDEIELGKESEITPKGFQSLSDKYALFSEERDEIFTYLKRVGSIR